MTYLGNTPTTQSFISGTDYFNGDGATVAFTLSRAVVSVNDIEVVINNVVQQPNTAYTISGTTITFTSAPSSGTSNIYVRYLSTTTQSITPSQNTVSYSTWNSNLQNQTWGFKNRLINGGMVIDQRNAGSSVTITSLAQNVYTLDRWCAVVSAASKISVQRSSTAPAGFNNSFLVTSLAATSVAATDYYQIRQYVEGYNVADLNWGSSNAKTVTLSFWVRSSVTGTYSATVFNNTSDRFYPTTYTVNAANTWEQKSITIPGDSSGTWAVTNGTGLVVGFNLGMGTDFTTSSTNTWVASSGYAVTSTTSLVNTNGATFYLTGVQLEVGTQATNFDVRSYQNELILCQRYYEKIAGENSYDFYMDGYNTGTSALTVPLYWKVNKRTNPSITIVGSPVYGNCSGLSVPGSGSGSNTATMQVVVTTTGRAYCYFASNTYLAISAEL